jgi:cell division protein FtsI (penicillin-binding protein 3)
MKPPTINRVAPPTINRTPPPSDPSAPHANAFILRRRLAAIYLLFVGFLGLVGGRLVQLQILSPTAIQRLADRQLAGQAKSAPYRLPVFDRNGEELAVSVPASSVYARPRQVRLKKRTAAQLAKILGGGERKWQRLLNSPRAFVWLKRQVSPEIGRQLLNRNLDGIYLEQEKKRVYPNGEMAASVLGFTDIDGTGLWGLERSLNRELLQEESKFAMIRDGKGRPAYFSGFDEENPQRKGVYVTLDRRLQSAVEQELTTANKEFGANSVIAIVMDPHSGEVLAMGQKPGYDPNSARKASPELYANKGVSYLYEPGSTLKVLFAAEAIERGIMTRKTRINCEGGKIVVGDRTIREADVHHNFDNLSLEEVIRFSSNVGAVKVAQALGAEKVQETLSKFGLTKKTEVQLPGEAYFSERGPDFWKPIHVATVAFGQGVSTTPLQMVASFAPFANGGYWVRPRILLEKDRQSGLPPEDRVPVLRPQTVSAMRDILESVVHGKSGTGASAQIDGIRVAGKTGTAQKYVKDGGYKGGKYFSSFIGFLPADNPQLLIGVMVDEPSKEYYASQVAAPLFARIARRALHIRNAFPKHLAEVSASGLEKAATFPELLSEAGQIVLPDLKGVSIRGALQILGKQLHDVRIFGSGYLIRQTPTPGTTIQPNTKVTLHFAPPT